MSLLAAGLGSRRRAAQGAGRPVVGVETSWAWTPGPVAVVRDQAAGTVSATITASTDGFAMRSLRRAGRDGEHVRGDVGVVRPAPEPGDTGVLAGVVAPEGGGDATVSWWRHGWRAAAARTRIRRRSTTTSCCWTAQAPVTVAHEVTLTVTVDQRRVRRRRQVGPFDAALGGVGRGARAVHATPRRRRDGAVGAAVARRADDVWSRMRSDPSRGRPRQLRALRQSLATAAGRAGIEWGPMAVEEAWSTCRVDESVHRTYRMAALPMLPVPANWLDSLLTDTATTRTVTMVYEPIPLNKAAAAANRELTSIESSHEDKARRGFRVTARERRRLADVEGRETRAGPRSSRVPPRRPGHRDGADAADALDDACAQIENAAGKSLIDLRPLAARQGAGMGGVTAVGPLVQAGPAHDRPSPPAPAAAAQRRGPTRPPRRRARRTAPSATGRTRPADRERPPLLGARHGPAIPVDWHRSTMAHLCSMYPFHADRGFGEAGVYYRHQRHRRPRRVLLRPVRVLQRRARREPEHDGVRHRSARPSRAPSRR